MCRSARVQNAASLFAGTPPSIAALPQIRAKPAASRGNRSIHPAEESFAGIFSPRIDRRDACRARWRRQIPRMTDAVTAWTDRRRLPRDSRVDVLRGLALLMIFIDHVPGNVLSLVTMRNFGFADAAELFVLLSGFSSMMAYGGSFAREGVWPGLRRVMLRLLRIYLFQVLLLLAVVVLVTVWLREFGVEPESGAPFVHSGLTGLRHALTLQALPTSLNILPLYITLLGAFPVIYWVIRISPVVAFVASGALWAAVNINPSITLTNWLDGQGWFFDPFAWQFLFVLGVFGAMLMRRYNGNLPRPPWLRVAAWGYVGFALIALAPWQIWGWVHFEPIVIAPTSKTYLGPLRLIDILAIAALALGSTQFRTLADHKALRVLLVCGRNSLEVFSLGTILAMTGRLAFRTFGVTPLTQVLINGVGLGLLIGLALVLERKRHPSAATHISDAQPAVAAAGNSLANSPSA
jgi:hypothetical protein